MRLDIETLAQWYNAQERMPTVRETAEHFEVAPSTAYVRIIEAAAAGKIERRTAKDAWAK